MFSKIVPGFTFGAAQQRAFYHAIAPYTVGLLLQDGLSVGTGTLINWKSLPLILTANHNLEDTKASEVRFVFNPGGNLEDGPMSSIRDSGKLSRGNRLSLDNNVFADKQNDIVAIRLSDKNLPQAAKFYELDSTSQTVREGCSVILVGFAWDNSCVLENNARAIGVTTQIGNYSSNLNARSGLSGYNEEDHFLLPYTRDKDGVKPHGMSGAAAWCNRDYAGNIWAPKPLFYGIQTAWYKRPKLLKIVRLEPILNLLNTV